MPRVSFLHWLRRPRSTRLPRSIPSSGAYVVETASMPDGYVPPSGSLTPPGDASPPGSPPEGSAQFGRAAPRSHPLTC